MKKDTNELYNKIVQSPLDGNLVEQYSLKNAQIHSFMNIVAIDNEQRMKLNWLVKGNRPTNFFYNKVNCIKPS